eukprot:m51a1_g12997 putative tkl protein kinase (568) ;mRNA; f:500-2259
MRVMSRCGAELLGDEVLLEPGVALRVARTRQAAGVDVVELDDDSAPSDSCACCCSGAGRDANAAPMGVSPASGVPLYILSSVGFNSREGQVSSTEMEPNNAGPADTLAVQDQLRQQYGAQLAQLVAQQEQQMAAFTQEQQAQQMKFSESALQQVARQKQTNPQLAAQFQVQFAQQLENLAMMHRQQHQQLVAVHEQQKQGLLAQWQQLCLSYSQPGGAGGSGSGSAQECGVTTTTSLPAGWIEVVSPAGRYYVNAVRGVSQWTRPDETQGSQGAAAQRTRTPRVSEYQELLLGRADSDGRQPRAPHGGWAVQREDIKLRRRLTNVTVGEEFCGEWKDMGVAVRVLPPGLGVEDQRLAQDLDAMFAARHKNIVNFLGACLGPPHCVIFEQHEMPSLSRMIFEWHRSLTAEAVGTALLDVCRAMSYLHGLDPPIAHGNLTCNDVLVADRSFHVKVSGLVRPLRRSAGTLSHMSPQRLGGVAYSETADDAYSFGVMAYEVCEAKRVYAGLSPTEVISRVCYRGERPEFTPACPAALRELIPLCWAAEESSRFRFAQLELALGSAAGRWTA